MKLGHAERERKGVYGEYVLRRGEEGQVALYENGSKLAEFFFEDVIRKGHHQPGYLWP